MIYQRESCPRTGRKHWQAYVEFTNKMTMASIKSHFDDDTVHIEMRRGSQIQAIDYCRKEASRDEGAEPRIFGMPRIQGGRSDLDEMHAYIASGHTRGEVHTEFEGMALRFSRNIRETQEALHGDLTEIERRMLIGRFMEFRRTGDTQYLRSNNIVAQMFLDDLKRNYDLHDEDTENGM